MTIKIADNAIPPRLLSKLSLLSNDCGSLNNSRAFCLLNDDRFTIPSISLSKICALAGSYILLFKFTRSKI